MASLGLISVRKATVRDASILSDIGELTFTHSYASIIPTEQLASYTRRAFSVGQLRSELTISRVVYLLAIHKTTPCGYSKLEPTTPPPQIVSPNPVELVRLYVLPQWTGKRIGRPRLSFMLVTRLAGK
jgi:hypothetical protein